MTNEHSYLVVRKCPVCGKGFIPAIEHVYHLYGNQEETVCSWSCMLASEPKPKNNSGYYSVNEIAEIMGYDLQQVRRLISRGDIRGEKHNKQWRVTESDLDEFLKRKKKKRL